MNFREFLNEADLYTKAVSFLTKQGKELDILKSEPKEVKIRNNTYTSFIFIKDVDLQKLKGELDKRFPDLSIITQTQTRSIEIYKD